ncbi:hypothetical protein [Salibacterium halotolerans]|uniref:Uncharacterized protein n=1 Tax=Salibacterium halotolerans TaxID=1884432 RepID=A0A1I5U1U3_9BACI|nr:hypothetical protein [Salibacterium halotolerans]SFP89239.1 hypothetical protein SAMN05518683_11230 [Salibacterium halotolerans]
MAYIMVDDMQIPAGKYETVEDAKQAATSKDVIVRDNDEEIWVVDEENYPKIESLGYTKINE